MMIYFSLLYYSTFFSSFHFSFSLFDHICIIFHPHKPTPIPLIFILMRSFLQIIHTCPYLHSSTHLHPFLCPYPHPIHTYLYNPNLHVHTHLVHSLDIFLPSSLHCGVHPWESIRVGHPTQQPSSRFGHWCPQPLHRLVSYWSFLSFSIYILVSSHWSLFSQLSTPFPSDEHIVHSISGIYTSAMISSKGKLSLWGKVITRRTEDTCSFIDVSTPSLFLFFSLPVLSLAICHDVCFAVVSVLGCDEYSNSDETQGLSDFTYFYSFMPNFFSIYKKI